MQHNIYQIYYNEFSRKRLDTGFIPYNNIYIDIDRNIEFEYGVMRKLYHLDLLNNNNFNGVLSWKFSDKTGWSSHELFKKINSYKNIDVFTINPYPQYFLYQNVWEQGERYNPGIIDLIEIMYKIASLNTDELKIRMDKGVECYCNYWIAGKRFINEYFKYSEKLYNIFKTNSEIRHKLKNGIRDKNIEAPFFPFIFERLFSTFLAVNRDKYTIANLEVKTDFENKLRKKYKL